MVKTKVGRQSKKVVILLGAGSTYANADPVYDFEKPPLNFNFFKNTRTSNERSDSVEMQTRLENIRVYFGDNHGIDIFSESDDSLEKIMSQVFSDAKNPSSRNEAYPVFRNLLTLLHERIGETTNRIIINNSKPLFRLANFYIRSGIVSGNLTIISFNYDIYVEKTLAALTLSFFNPNQTIFSLQHCYGLDVGLPTRPPHPMEGYFPVYLDHQNGSVRVLKLHGSLNWYSHYPRDEIDLEDMFNPNRPLKVSGEKQINSTRLRYLNREGRNEYTLPIIVPPIENKAEVYHSKILHLWEYAEETLKNADELLIFGYSCPPSDKDSENLLRTSLVANRKIQEISIIDTNQNIIDRYREFLPSKDFYLFSDINQFLESNNFR